MTYIYRICFREVLMEITKILKFLIQLKICNDPKVWSIIQRLYLKAELSGAAAQYSTVSTTALHLPGVTSDTTVETAISEESRAT